MSDCSIKYNKTETSKLTRFLSTLHKDLLKSCEYIQTININSNIDDQTKEIFFNTKYFPNEIQNYIRNNKAKKYIYTARVNNKNVVLKITNYITKYTTKVLSQYAKIIFIIIHLLSLHTSKSCSKNLHINIYLTPYRKFFPSNKSDIIGVDNVNSGFSNIGCLETSEITIYREEEWMKVLIHELFHNLNLDFSEMDITKWARILSIKFEIKSDYAIYETYCETWARILNVAIKSFTEEKKKFITNFKTLMDKERKHSLRQASLIINRFKHPSEYRETSNVFCYYILTAGLMNNYLDFILWCDKNNTHILKFKNTEKNLKSFVELILTEANSDSFKKSLDCMSKYKGNERSLRMTIV